MLEEITDYYISSNDNELLIKTTNTAAKGRSRTLKQPGETILENMMPVGFADARWCSAKYKELLNNLMIMTQSKWAQLITKHYWHKLLNLAIFGYENLINEQIM